MSDPEASLICSRPSFDVLLPVHARPADHFHQPDDLSQAVINGSQDGDEIFLPGNRFCPAGGEGFGHLLGLFRVQQPE